MKKTLIFYKPEYADLAIKLRDNYRAHDHEKADIVSVEEHDDIEYAEKMQYDEAVFRLLSRKWWDYWKDYWRLRGTRDTLPKD